MMHLKSPSCHLRTFFNPTNRQITSIHRLTLFEKLDTFFIRLALNIRLLDQ